MINEIRMNELVSEHEFIQSNLIEGERIRQDALKKLISYAKKNTRFYSSIKGNQLTDFPVINKNTILQNYKAFTVEKENIPEQVGEIHIQETSGSTGVPFKIPQDTECRLHRIAAIRLCNKNALQSAGGGIKECIAQIRSFAHYYPNNTSDIVYNKETGITYIDNSNLIDEKLFRICNAINESGATIVRGYMTSLDSITRFAVDNGIKFKNHPMFLSGGELLLESLRLRVVNDLNCSIISQYANEENGVIGQSKVNDVGSSIILNRANLIVEILSLNSDEKAKKGEIGRIVVTDLRNYAMPMIRYEIGDIACLGEENSGILLSIEKLQGRKTDMIFKTNGMPVDLFNSMPSEIYNNIAVKQWQFIQEGIKIYKLKISISDSRMINENFVRQYFLNLLGKDAEFSMEYCEELPILQSGKRKVVINMMKD